MIAKAPRARPAGTVPPTHPAPAARPRECGRRAAERRALRNRRVGRQVEGPASPQRKITSIHTLARDEDIAAAVTTDFLKCPTVAAKVPDQDKVRPVEEFTRDGHQRVARSAPAQKRSDSPGAL
ncbi:DUF6192 family protein [Streptomyces sp. Qhu-G9]|uniref:DUF6192 family protein n=1 Tax=Streptomyces sp. Qhu-G9 TaxID=3452799 RepID=UPI003AF87E3D